ncbi:MAG: hypothetical protein SGI88_21575 [Candidatus Hydrogenedentes bacterium]|nr:hypothetical protein [Candidatus Hydrogenedentota bacterium]
MKSFCKNADGKQVVESVIDESKYFIEWTNSDLKVDVATELSELRCQLAQWQLNFDALWNDPPSRKSMQESADVWSNRVLSLSGLLNKDHRPYSQD